MVTEQLIRHSQSGTATTCVFWNKNSESLGLLDAVCGSETSVTHPITKQGYIPGDFSVKTDKIKGKGKGRLQPIKSDEGTEVGYRYTSTLS